MADLSAFAVGGWRHPIPSHRTVSSPFGASRTGTRPAECIAGHCGVDFKAPVGTPVYAVHDGVVLIAESNEVVGGDAGRYVKLEHAGGQARSWYIHLDTLNVSKGQQVYAGQQVGTVGTTGVKQSPAHLHFALAVPSSSGSSTYVYVDPAPLVAGWNGGGSDVLGFALGAGLALLLWRSLR